MMRMSDPHAGLQVSTCSSYDLCQTVLYHLFQLSTRMLCASRIDLTPLSERHGLVLTAVVAWRVDISHSEGVSGGKY